MSVAVVIASGCAPAPAGGDNGPPSYRAVHIDTLAPDKVEQFVAAREAWVVELERAHATDGRGVFLQVGDDQMFTIRSFATFGDPETRRAAIEQSLAAVPMEARERYEAASASAVVSSHPSDIWILDSDLSYVPATGPLTEETADVGRIVFDTVRPDPRSVREYYAAVGEQIHALADARYRMTRLAFLNGLSDRHVITLWLAHSQAENDAAPSVDAAVAGARSLARAAELERLIAQSVEHSDSDPIVVRHDLTRLQAP